MAKALVIMHGIHEGHWKLQFRFDISAAQVNFNGLDTLAAFTPIVETALVRCDKPDAYTVDAAESNPAPKHDAPEPSRILVV